eukprot:s379_g4.t2
MVWRVVQMMRQAEVQTNVFHYSAAVNACSRGKPNVNWPLALAILEDLEAATTTPNSVTLNSAISVCEKGGQWARALDLFEQLPGLQVTTDVVSFTGAINGCARVSSWQMALCLLWSMADASVSPNIRSYNGALAACVAEGHWELALHLLWLPSESLDLNAISFNTAMNACDKGGQWQPALQLMDAMAAYRLQPTAVSFGTAISAASSAGRWEVALQGLCGMAAARLPQDCLPMPQSCRTGANHWEAVLRLLEDMESQALTPNSQTFGAALGACVRSWESALWLLKKMQNYQMVPDALHVGSALEALRQCGCGESASWQLLTSFRSLWEAETPTAPWAKSPAVGGCIVGAAPGLVALNKPPDVSTESVLTDLAQQLQVSFASLGALSRLDHPTSGVLPVCLAAEGSGAARWLQAQFAARLVRKEYRCLCEGPSLGQVGSMGQVDRPLFTDELKQGGERTSVDLVKGRRASTEYEILHRYRSNKNPAEELMLLCARPLTGRTHQIRVHLASLGRPILGDLSYGLRGKSALPTQRLFLHCFRVQLRDASGSTFTAEAQLPPDLLQILQSLTAL